MINVNSIMIGGRVTNNPEMSAVGAKGTPKTKFCVAVNSFYKEEKKTTFFNVIVWGKSAEFCAKYLGKGKEVIVEGRVEIRSYQDKNNETKWVTEVIANKVDLCGSRGGDKAKATESDIGGFDKWPDLKREDHAQIDCPF